MECISNGDIGMLGAILGYRKNMRYIILFSILLLVEQAISQSLSNEDYKILEAITCRLSSEKIKIESICFYSITKYDFYQDPAYLDKGEPQEGKIRIGHTPIIEKYDRNPYKTILNHIDIDTSLVNRFLDSTYSGTHWNNIDGICKNLVIQNSLRYEKIWYRIIRLFRNIFSSKKFRIVGRPLYLNEENILINTTYLNFKKGNSVKEHDKNLYFLQKVNDEWIIKEKFNYNMKNK